MTIQEIQDRFNDASQALAERFPEMIQKIAMNAKGKVQLRIQKSGESSEGSSFGIYSPQYKRKKEKRYGATSVAVINLTATSMMWTNTQIVDTKIDGSKYVVTIGGGTTDTQNKIDWNSERYGDILQPSESEISDLQDAYGEEFDKIINEFL